MQRTDRKIDAHLEASVTLNQTVFQICRVYNPYRTVDAAFFPANSKYAH